jgi:ComF family protein
LGNLYLEFEMLSAKDASVSVSAFVRDLLFPATCLGCRVITGRQGSLCSSCWRKVKFLERPYCEVFGTPFLSDHGADAISGDAIANPPPFHRSRAVATYSDISRQLVQGLKYNDRTDLAPWMAQWMLRAGRELLADAHMIVPIPLHPRRFLSRRFNQAAELARPLARSSGVAFEPTALVRTRKTIQQVGLKATQREDNVRGAFAVPDKMKVLVKGKTVLLIDDVYTTGATVSSATKALLKAEAASVDVLTFARVIPGDFSMNEWEAI